MFRTSSTIWLFNNQPSNIDEDAEVVGGIDQHEKIKRILYASNSNKRTSYSNPDTKKAFTQLRQIFTKAPILEHFDPKKHIGIETDTSSYVINWVIKELTPDGFNCWHLVAYFSYEIIPTKTRYKSYDIEYLAIVEDFKT